MSPIPFVKMHGLGNDFVILDARTTVPTPAPENLSAEQIRALSDRKLGIGCDQLILISDPRSAQTAAYMQIFNADGGEVEACGNATRCVASLLMADHQNDHAVVETVVGLLDCRQAADGLVTVDMGPVNLDWTQIPLAQSMDTAAINLTVGPLQQPVGVNVGNPHAVFFVENAEAIDLTEWGPQVENHALFPQRTNVEVVQRLEDGRLRMRVWERGVGITQACGTGACATLVAAARRGITGRKAEVILDGGSLLIEWRDDNHIIMTGPVARSFSGLADPSLFLRNSGT